MDNGGRGWGGREGGTEKETDVNRERQKEGNRDRSVRLTVS